MKDQGENRTHEDFKIYGGRWGVNWVLQSPTTAVYICEIDNVKLDLGILHTTLSGKN